MKKRLLLSLLLLPLAATAQQNPRNVIFVVGDGMGTAQVHASIVAQQSDNSAFLRFPITGFSRTHSNNKYTTDSGAGGSALMTGHKIDNYHISLSSDGTPYPSFLTKAKQSGLAAGFVVTSTVVDATPASTYAHVPYRKMFDTISLQMVQSGFDVMIGGGKKYFLPENRKDGLHLLDSLGTRGYRLAFSPSQLDSIHEGPVCALISEGNPDSAPSRGSFLKSAVLKALEIVGKNNKGFVLMVEGSQIDWANHNNDSSYLEAELADFESVLQTLIDFVERDGNTLLVVTADHESGGLTLPSGKISHGANKMHFATGGHTGVMVPLFAMGPGAERFSGIHQNTDFYNIILSLLNL